MLRFAVFHEFWKILYHYFLWNILCLYLWLRWVFVAVPGLSLAVWTGAALPCGLHASQCGGFSCYRAWAPVHLGFGSCGTWVSGCGSQTLEHRLSKYSTWGSCQVAPSQTRGRTHVSCIGRWILYPWATSEALDHYFLKHVFCFFLFLSFWKFNSMYVLTHTALESSTLVPQTQIAIFYWVVCFWYWTLWVVCIFWKIIPCW